MIRSDQQRRFAVCNSVVHRSDSQRSATDVIVISSDDIVLFAEMSDSVVPTSLWRTQRSLLIRLSCD